ncbi:MAG: RNA 2',3'-cyclic phosphodiesterase [Proteobacteria bacterium]|nr:RNA 2',3'-cyclic phosphodiesterase [Pseudomonadota bacterium]
MPRLFTGLEIPADVALDLQIMQGGIPGARWMDPSNFHLTLRFIGDIETGLAREIAHALDGVQLRTFRISLKGVGLFGGNKPHSLYAGVEETGELRRLHDLHERICQVLGLPAEGRKFVPHVTLARLNQPEPRALQRWIEVHSLYRSPSFTVEQFVLFSSRPLRGGGPYAVEEAYPLSGLVGAAP